jgi:hypothetical protein
MVAVATVEFTYGAQTVQLVVYAERLLGLGRGGYGLLLAATGAGGVLSAFAAGRLTVSRRISLVVIVTGSVGCATQLAYAGVDSAPLAVAVTVLGGIGLVLCEVVGETALARIVPREALGRIMGIFDAASVGAMIAGALMRSESHCPRVERLTPQIVQLTDLERSRYEESQRRKPPR